MNLSSPNLRLMAILAVLAAVALAVGAAVADGFDQQSHRRGVAGRAATRTAHPRHGEARMSDFVSTLAASVLAVMARAGVGSRAVLDAAGRARAAAIGARSRGADLPIRHRGARRTTRSVRLRRPSRA